MIKQSVIYLFLSIIAVVFSQYVHLAVVYIDMLYTYIHLKLASLFTMIGINGMASKILLLASIPLIIIAIPALIYRFVKGQAMPHLLALTWCIWVVIVLSTILIH